MNSLYILLTIFVFIFWRNRKRFIPELYQAKESEKNKIDYLERRKVIGEYGQFMEKNPSSPLTIEDASVLPYPKEKILNALMFEIACSDIQQPCDHFEVGAISLAQYQEGVGKERLEMLGIDITKLPLPETAEEIQKQEAQIIEMESIMRNRFNAFNKLVEVDLVRIKNLVDAAHTLRRKLPAQKKSDLEGA